MKTTVGKCSYINLNQTVRSSFDLRKCDPRVSVSLWEMRIAKFRRSRAYKGKAGTEKNASSPCSLLEAADSEAFARGSVDQWHVTMFLLECLIHCVNFQSLASSNFRRMTVALRNIPWSERCRFICRPVRSFVYWIAGNCFVA